MKYTILLSVLSIVLPAGCGTTHDVKTAGELLGQIGPNRTIRLAAGDYILSDVEDRRMEYVRWDPEHDGKTVTIRNVDNLTLIGAKGGKTRLLVRPRYTYVLNFEKCRNVRLENVVMGHTPKTGYCTCGVLGVVECTGIKIVGCDLFGCGTEGMTLKKVRNMWCDKTIVRDCTYGIMTMSGCDDIRFTKSKFLRNREYRGVSIHDSRNVLFAGCRFEKNRAKGSPLIGAVSSSNIRLAECEFSGNEVKQLTNGSAVEINGETSRK